MYLFHFVSGVHVKLEKLAKHPKLDEILDVLRLQVSLAFSWIK